MLTQFIGGPQDGLVCETTGAVPVIIVGNPRGRSLLDHPLRTAKWEAGREWYEAANIGGIPLVQDPKVPFLMNVVFE